MIPIRNALHEDPGEKCGLGLFVILAYALGQLVQGVGNGIEWALWKAWGGRPTEQVLAGKLLSAEQHTRLMASLAQGPNVPRETSQLSTSERLAIVREVQSVVAAAGRDKRVETFLGNYGLLRGLAASFLVLTVLTLVLGQGLTTAGAFGALFLLATQRMHRFSKDLRWSCSSSTCWLAEVQCNSDNGRGDRQDQKRLADLLEVGVEGLQTPVHLGQQGRDCLARSVSSGSSGSGTANRSAPSRVKAISSLKPQARWEMPYLSASKNSLRPQPMPRCKSAGSPQAGR